ncbi:Laminin G domain protein [Anaerohalosphaera lusitana]|uniref:Laminin G domain protein n=1 Tax=Anaerohalosphaera lusitana TaxID=1936003 RepID=A0A1U9NLP9_9BACT|nr:LamG-like jellyroll fold domain-containing protein [Anaerohalosphaera lusitana]AQT68500.1 Laminin G domain protein [Anaerohalosphaera lusitana]
MNKKVLPLIMILMLAVTSYSYAGVVAYWSFDDGSGTVATDDSGNGADGVLGNGPTWVTGKVGGALQFDGVDDEVEIPIDGDGNATLSGATNFTVAAWIQTTSTAGGTIVQQRDEQPEGYYGQYRFRLNDDGTINFYIYNGGEGFNFNSTATVNDGQWHHVLAYRDGTDGYIVIDGVQDATGTGDGPKELWPTTKVGIGRDIRDDASPIEATLDEVYILDEAATPELISALMGDAAIPASPANGAVQVPTTTTLEWTPPTVASATGYDLYVGSDASTLASVATNLQTTSHELTGLQFEQTYAWRVDTRTSAGTVTGPIASFTVRNAEPVIVTQPDHNLLTDGETAEFTVDALWATSYQWYKDSTALTGEAGSTLTVSAVTAADEGLYTCEMTSDESATIVTTDPAKLVLKKLIAYYPFDGTLADTSGFGNDATYVADPNNTVTTPSYVTGLTGLGSAIAFEGALETGDEAYVDVPVAVFDESVPAQITVAFWYYGDPAVMPANNNVFEARSANDESRVMGSHLPWGNSTIYWDAGSEDPTADDYNRITYGSAGTPELFKGQWNFIALTKDAAEGTMAIYINGVKMAEGGGRETTINDIASFQIGGGFDATYHGYIDEFRVYNYALDSVQQATLYTDVTGESVCTEEIAMDLTDDCQVDMADLLELMAYWMDCNIVPDCVN